MMRRSLGRATVLAVFACGTVVACSDGKHGDTPPSIEVSFEPPDHGKLPAGRRVAVVLDSGGAPVGDGLLSMMVSPAHMHFTTFPALKAVRFTTRYEDLAQYCNHTKPECQRPVKIEIIPNAPLAPGSYVLTINFAGLGLIFWGPPGPKHPQQPSYVCHETSPGWCGIEFEATPAMPPGDGGSDAKAAPVPSGDGGAGPDADAATGS